MWKFFNSSGAEITAEASQGGAVTALPSAPTDGDEITFMDSLTAPTYAWRLRYVSAKSSNKWQFVGGSPATDAVTAAESITSATFGNLTTTGPSITLPVAGDYLVTITTEVYGNVNNVWLVEMSYAIGGTAATTSDAASFWPEGGTGRIKSITRTQLKQGLTAVTLTAKYRADGVNGTVFQKRFMSVTPVAVGG